MSPDFYHCIGKPMAPVLALIAAAAVSASVLPIGRSAPTAERQGQSLPNVVMIIADDQGWGDYSFMGHPHIETPNIDRLAKASLVFRHGYVPSSLCRPSLATMITGLYPHQHKITSNDPPLPPGKKGAAARRDPRFIALREAMVRHIDQVPTLPRLLGRIGYVSHQSGKWWEGNFCRCGFTYGMTHGDPKRGGRHGDVGLKIGREGLKPVTDFIDQSVAQGKPFYVWYAPFMPHLPHTPPKRLVQKYRTRTRSIHIARYWAMCEWFDETCGELLGHLDRRGVAEDTFVIFLCDNGWIQDPNSERYAPRSKRSPYDGGVRTPILLRWPKRIRHRISDQPVISIDLVPTILAAVGLKPTSEMQGVNVLDADAVKNRRIIFGEVFTHNAVDVERPAANLQYRWAIADKWKLIVPHHANVPNGQIELYNLDADPFETRNLAEERPAVVTRLRQQIDRWWRPD